MLEDLEDPYQYVSWGPRDTSTSPPTEIGMLDFLIGCELLDFRRRTLDPLPAIPTLHRRMRDKMAYTFGERWRTIESHGIRLNVRPPSIVPAPSQPDHTISKQWTIRIWGSLELREELRPVMGTPCFIWRPARDLAK